MFKFFKQKNKRKGFTLVETLIAISIFSVSLVVLMSVLGSGINNTTYAKNKMIASYLAQEGIEYMRNMRDTYVLYTDYSASSQDWDSFKSALSASSCGTSGCDVDVNISNAMPPKFGVYDYQTLISSCSTLDSCSLYLDNDGNYNTKHIGINSGFTRIITVTLTSNTDEIKITSDVSWNQGSGKYHVILSEDLFNWVE